MQGRAKWPAPSCAIAPGQDTSRHRLRCPGRVPCVVIPSPDTVPSSGTRPIRGATSGKRISNARLSSAARRLCRSRPQPRQRWTITDSPPGRSKRDRGHRGPAVARPIAGPRPVDVTRVEAERAVIAVPPAPDRWTDEGPTLPALKLLGSLSRGAGRAASHARCRPGLAPPRRALWPPALPVRRTPARRRAAIVIMLARVGIGAALVVGRGCHRWCLPQAARRGPPSSCGRRGTRHAHSRRSP